MRAVGLRLIQRQDDTQDVLQNNCFHKFHNIHRKTPVLWFLLESCRPLLKRDLISSISLDG